MLFISRVTALALLVLYACFLFFQLGTHKDVFSGEGDDPSDPVYTNEAEAASPNGYNHAAGDANQAGSSLQQVCEVIGNFVEGPSASADTPLLTLTAALAWLAGITGLVAVSSELLTGSIEAVSRRWGISDGFVGFIILPIAGNACEHITAVVVASRNKMDLSLGVAVGSSLQIALFAIPLVTVVGWATGRPFSLGFDPFAALILTVSVMHAAFVMVAGRSNWFMGVQLLATYFLTAVAYSQCNQ